MADALLPPEFSDLEPFAKEWCLASEPERYAKRLASTMDEMQAFYDAIFPRAEEAIVYLDKFPLHDLPDDAHRLLQLLYSLILVSFRRRDLAAAVHPRHRNRLLRAQAGAGPLISERETFKPTRTTMRLKDKVAIITGGGQGIGREYALRFAREGAKVVIGDIRDSQAEEVVAGDRDLGSDGLALRIDVSKEEDTKRLAAATAERFGRIDILLNNAAIFYDMELDGPAASTTSTRSCR